MKKQKKHPSLNLPPIRDPNFTQQLVDQLQFPPSNTDTQGWYTGVPLDPKERPVQDADDL